MPPASNPPSASRDTYMAVVLCVLVGLPLFVFFNIITSGLFLLVLESVFGLAFLGAINYLLWGRSLNHAVEGEREEAAVRERLESEAAPFRRPASREDS